MGSLFAPADAIIGRLSYTYKIALTSVLFLVPVSYLVWANVNHIQGRMDSLEQESRGLKLIRAVQAIYALVPKQRDCPAGSWTAMNSCASNSRASSRAWKAPSPPCAKPVSGAGAADLKTLFAGARLVLPLCKGFGNETDLAGESPPTKRAVAGSRLLPGRLPGTTAAAPPIYRVACAAAPGRQWEYLAL